MTERDHILFREEERNVYASHEDFQTIFNEDLKALYQLSFLLTRHPAKAERCLVTGLEDCVSGNPVFREWARSWAKRAIIQNAIRELKPRPSQSDAPLSGVMLTGIDQQSRGPAGHFEIDAVLRLADFDRFVFVMSVLEHYSEHDCALLLGCPPERFGRVVLVLLRNWRTHLKWNLLTINFSYRRRNEMCNQS